METIIEAYRLRKDFKDKTAVNHISFSISKGEIFGLLGHNGAGKTTTIRMLTGQLRPTSGESFIAGFNSSSEQELIKPLIGVVADTQNLYERMSGFENLKLFADLFGVKKTRIYELLELFQLQHRSKEKVETYSNGMKQRLLIARALLHEPDVIFLDEPTRGLDPTSARETRESMKRLAERGTTIFLTTHNMEEADTLCQRVAFIRNGELMALDTPQSLKLLHGERTVIITFTNGEKAVVPMSDINDINRLPSIVNGRKILTIHSQEATLEDVFVKLAGQEVEQ